MKKKLLGLTALVLALSMFLAACGGKDSSNGSSDSGSDSKAGGTLTYVMSTPFDGLLDVNFYESATDAEVLSFTQESLIDYDDKLVPQPNIASWKTEDNKVYHFTFKEGVKWHNGDELVVDDWIFAIESIATIGADSARWVNVNTIEGAEAFNEGKADSISGLKKINDYEIEITFEKAAVNNLENLWTYPLNRKHFEGVDPLKMSESKQVRLEPMGTGPFKIDKVLPGESVELSKFPDYWQGEPKIDKVIVKVIDASLIPGEFGSGKIDMSQIAPASLPDVEATGKAKIEVVPGLSYYYIGFKFGEMKDGKIVMNRDKYNDKKLRQAMMYALNRQEWIDAFFGGLGKPIDSVIPSSHWIAATNEQLPNNYTYDPEKAKQLLDEAGYKDVNGDGKREDPNGNEFVINFSHYASSNPTFETRARQLTQYWDEVGLNTKLSMTDSGLYYEQIQKDHKSVEVFYGGWGTGADPDPWGLWGDDTSFNYPRWTNERALEVMKEAIDYSVVGQDTEKRKDLYVEFQQIFNEELPVLPILELEDAYALSERLKGVTFDVSGFNSPHEWYLED
ncbi:oligopeptide ABC transporter substrate-binding protein [Bacillus kwashiorkori]|uniref:oligopeptide ABC transporter substrate-binding protein n=1 Tax=Bacillus kwashiorkori TaxID=1522318 RepID=UPI000980B18D|nr:oligopeptide ABC transporter substrate-binding protein [Bacillus kwashiorkori]